MLIVVNLFISMIYVRIYYVYTKYDVYVLIWVNRNYVINHPHYPLSDGKSNLGSVERVVVMTTMEWDMISVMMVPLSMRYIH